MLSQLQAMLLCCIRSYCSVLPQEIEILKSLSFDRSIVQFYGTCPWLGKTMLVLEHMEVIFFFRAKSIYNI